jgi:hypothetical protein
MCLSLLSFLYRFVVVASFHASLSKIKRDQAAQKQVSPGEPGLTIRSGVVFIRRR